MIRAEFQCQSCNRKEWWASSSLLGSRYLIGLGAGLGAVLKIVEDTLTVLADSVLQEQPPVRTKKREFGKYCLYILVHSSIF